MKFPGNWLVEMTLNISLEEEMGRRTSMGKSAEIESECLSVSSTCLHLRARVPVSNDMTSEHKHIATSTWIQLVYFCSITCIYVYTDGL